MIDVAEIDIVAIGFWFILVAVEFGIFFYLIRLYMKSEERNKMSLAICLIFLFMALGRIYFIYFDYFLTKLTPALYPSYLLDWKLATLFHIIGFGFLFVVSEYKVFQGKDYYAFFWGFLGIALASLLVPDFRMAEGLITFSIVFAAFIPISYFYLAKQMPGPPRRNIFLIIVGVAILAIGMALVSITFVELLGADKIQLLFLISPLFQISGLLIAAKGFQGLYFQTLT